MSTSVQPASAEPFPLAAEDLSALSPDGTQMPSEQLPEPFAYERMPPVPAEELEATKLFRPDGIVRGIANAWHRVFPERPFDPDRRKLVGNMAIIGIAATQLGQAGYLHSEVRRLNAAMEARWTGNEPSLNFIGEVPLRPKELAIFYPGFGDPAVKREAKDVKANGHIDPNVPIAYVDYSNRGPKSISQLTQAVYRAVPDVDSIESLTSIGRSLGGPLSLGVEAQLGIPVKLKIVSSSPLEVGDADKATIGATLARLPDARFTDTGIKYGINLWDDIASERPNSPLDNFSEAALSLFSSFGGHDNFHFALNKTLEGMDRLAADGARAWGGVWYGVDPLSQQRELRTWWNEHLTTDPSKLDPVFLRGIRASLIPGFTKFFYTATDHPSTDTTVKVIAGAYHWRDFMLNVAKLPPEDVKILGLPYDGHADLGATLHYMAPLMARDTGAPNILADGQSSKP